MEGGFAGNPKNFNTAVIKGSDPESVEVKGLLGQTLSQAQGDGLRFWGRIWFADVPFDKHRERFFFLAKK